MAVIPAIHTTAARNISLTELGLRGSLRVTQSMLAVGITRENIDELQLARDIEQIFRAMDEVHAEAFISGNRMSDAAGVNDIINSLGEVARNHGIRFPRSFTLLLKQFLYFDRYVQLLDPGASLFNEERVVMGS